MIAQYHQHWHVCTRITNHFLRNGDITRFADWRFVHRARLDCVPLNGSQRFGNKNRKCRRCGYANETLPHVLCHCKPNFVAITKRHNAIQDRLVRAFNASAYTTVRIKTSVPGLDGSLRPDFIAVNDTCKTVAIIDVTMSFENRYADFPAEDKKSKRNMHPWLSTTIDRDIVFSSMLSLLVHLFDGTQPMR